jgi:hypothetical protein
MDFGTIEIKAYNVKKTSREILAFYQIDKWDLVDIGNAKQVVITIAGSDNKETLQLSKNNIDEYKLFASVYVLGALFVPDYAQNPDRRWGFLSIGYGNAFAVWLSKYTDIFFSGSGLLSGDFFALGMGFAPFEYYSYGVRRTPVFDEAAGWYLDYDYRLPERHSEPLYHFGIMYGVVNRNLLPGVSLELGATIQYFFHNTGYREAYIINQVPLEPHTPVEVYRVLQGNAMEGFSGGIFIQAGVFWLQANSGKIWSAGLSAPLPWW